MGNKNKGKTFLLEKIARVNLPKGYTVTTRGISVVYPTTEKDIAGAVLIDTAGLETPLLKNSTIPQDMSLIARDKQLTELCLQRFVIKHSNVLIAVVGALTLSDQKLLHRITNDWKKSKASKLFVLHNLMNHETILQVNDYIKDILLQSFTFDLEKTQSINMKVKSDSKVENEQSSGIMTVYQQKVKNQHNDTQSIIHLIMAKEGSEAGNELNDKVVDYIQKQIDTNLNNEKFPIVEEMKQYLSLMSKDLFEEPKLEETDIQTDDKVIKLTTPKEIILKRCMVDELGVSNLYSNTFSPKCLCYIDGNQLIFEIEIGRK